MMTIAVALTVAAAPTQYAQAAPPAPAAPAAPAPRSVAATMKALGMSDAGIAVLRAQSQPDPDARALAAKRLAMRGQIATAAAATPFDIDGFAGLLRDASLLEGTARSRIEERIITTLKALPAADRPIYAKAVLNIPPPGPPPPPAAPAPKP